MTVQMDNLYMCFDILDDLSDDLEVYDYFHFLLINELFYELAECTENLQRRADFYCQDFPKYSLINGRMIFGDETELDKACASGDLTTIKLLHKQGYTITSSAIKGAIWNKSLETVKWIVETFGISEEDVTKIYMSEFHSIEVTKIIGWLLRQGHHPKLYGVIDSVYRKAVLAYDMSIIEYLYLLDKHPTSDSIFMLAWDRRQIKPEIFRFFYENEFKMVNAWAIRNDGYEIVMQWISDGIDIACESDE